MCASIRRFVWLVKNVATYKTVAGKTGNASFIFIYFKIVSIHCNPQAFDVFATFHQNRPIFSPIETLLRMTTLKNTRSSAIPPNYPAFSRPILNSLKTTRPLAHTIAICSSDAKRSKERGEHRMLTRMRERLSIEWMNVGWMLTWMHHTLPNKQTSHASTYPHMMIW